MHSIIKKETLQQEMHLVAWYEKDQSVHQLILEQQ